MTEPGRPQPEPVDVRAEMAHALVAAAGFLVEARDTATVAHRIVETVRDLFQAVGALLCRLDPRTGVLEAVAVSGDVGPEYGVHMVFALGTGTPGLAAATPEAVITANVVTDPRITLSAQTRAAIEHAPFRSVLAVRLMVHGTVSGTLCILDREGRTFTEADGQLAQAFAHQAALALENARLNEIAEAASAAAVAANRAKDEFLAVLSHELRAPLTSIYGWIRMLRVGHMDKPNTDRALEAIEQNTMLQTRLINDLLDVSRIVAGRLEITPQPVRLVATVMTAAESLRIDAETKGVQLLAESDTAECAVAGDQFRVHQIMTNLLGNAIKFTPRGGTVEVRVGRYGSTARITVRDSGQGIPADLLPRIFERFARGTRTAGRGEGGLGLGLSIVRHLVQIHGGYVVAESAGVGRGATFVVFLPVTDQGVEPLPAPRDGKAAAAGVRGRTILVVEDNPDVRELIVLVLRDAGAEVIEAGSLAEGLAALTRSAPDLVVTDLILPDGNGVDLLTNARARAAAVDAGIPMIALTGLGEPGQRRRALWDGFAAYLLKPIDPMHLVEAASRAVGRRPAA